VGVNFHLFSDQLYVPCSIVVVVVVRFIECIGMVIQSLMICLARLNLII